MTDDTDLMRRLFDQAKDTGPAEAAIDRLIYCHLLERLTGGDMTVAMEQFADPGTAEAAMTEPEALPDHERAHVAGRVSAMWSDALTRSVSQVPGSGVGVLRSRRRERLAAQAAMSSTSFS